MTASADGTPSEPDETTEHLDNIADAAQEGVPATPEPVPDDAQVDVPPPGQSTGNGGDLIPAEDPEGKHRRGMDRTKLVFGIWLIASCLGIFVILSVVQYLTQQLLPEPSALVSALDLLKLISTTALGFVFGRSLDQDKDHKKGP